jgi:hypothetical protein
MPDGEREGEKTSKHTKNVENPQWGHKNIFFLACPNACVRAREEEIH